MQVWGGPSWHLVPVCSRPTLDGITLRGLRSCPSPVHTHAGLYNVSWPSQLRGSQALCPCWWREGPPFQNQCRPHSPIWCLIGHWPGQNWGMSGLRLLSLHPRSLALQTCGCREALSGPGQWLHVEAGPMAEAAWGLPAQCGGHKPPVSPREYDRLATLFHLPGPCVTELGL